MFQIISSPFQESFIARFSQMRTLYLELRKENSARQLGEAPQYNVFKVLGLSRSEVRTHSAFLSHLLSPTADHGQGMLFLQSFLRLCASRYPEFPPLPESGSPENWVVNTELSTHYGRMDIVIQNPSIGFLCVIENKVDAGEGQVQLERYGKWMYEHRNIYPFQALGFLTIRGVPANTAGDTPYFCLSYHKDIADWLQQAMDDIQAPAVRAVAQQYHAVVSGL